MNFTNDELEALIYAANRVMVADQQWHLRRMARGGQPLADPPTDALATARDKAKAELERHLQSCATCHGRGWLVQRCEDCKRYESHDEARTAHNVECTGEDDKDEDDEEPPSCCDRKMRRCNEGLCWHCSYCGGMHRCSDPQLRAGALCPRCSKLS